MTHDDETRRQALIDAWWARWDGLLAARDALYATETHPPAPDYVPPPMGFGAPPLRHGVTEEDFAIIQALCTSAGKAYAALIDNGKAAREAAQGEAYMKTLRRDYPAAYPEP